MSYSTRQNDLKQYQSARVRTTSSDRDQRSGHVWLTLATLALCAAAIMTQFALPAQAEGINTITSVGKAYNDEGKLVYIERHREELSGNGLLRLRTNYYKPDDTPFGSIDSDFTRHPYLPSYQFVDSRFQRRAGLKHVAEGKVLAFNKKGADEKTREKEFEIKDGLIAGQGLHNFVLSNFNRLVKKQEDEDKTKIEFLMPLRQTTYGFTISKVKQTDTDVTFRVDFDSWFLRLVAPHIDVTYDLEKRRLRRYEGPSNLLTDDKGDQNVVLTYTYGDEPQESPSMQAKVKVQGDRSKTTFKK